jgi:predicted DNA-binding transcriptional regulator YafY
VNAFARRLALWRVLAASTEPLGLRDLAGRFGVSKHTVQRDLDALSIAGVAVLEERQGQAALFTILGLPPAPDG